MDSQRWGAAQQRLTHPALWAVIILTALWALFFWRLLTPVQADRVIFPDGDFTGHFYAFNQYQAQRLWDGEIPLWNPYNYAGDPFAANIQLGTWYPPRWLAIWLAGRAGWTLEAYQLEVAAHYWLVSLMMVACLRLLFKRPGAALAGSIIYTYSGYLTGYPMLQPGVLYSAAWLPLILCGAHASLTARRPGAWLALTAAGMGLSFLGGHPQTTLQIMYLTAAYLAYAAYQRRITPAGLIARAGLIFGVGALLAAVQLIPAQEFTRLSSRVAEESYAARANGFAPEQFIQMLWPTLSGVWSPLYIGAAGLLLALGTVLRDAKANAFWLGVIVISLLLSLGGNSILYDLFYVSVPGFGIFRQQERIAGLAVFALAILAASQVDWLLARGADDSPAYRRFRWLSHAHLLLAGAGLAVVTLAGFIQERGISAANVMAFVLLMSMLFTGWRLWQRGEARAGLVVAALVALLVIDLFSINTRSDNFVPDSPENRPQLPASLEAYRTAPQNIAGRVDGAAGLRGYGMYWNIPDIYGTGPFDLDSMRRLRGIPVERFWEVLAVRYITTRDEPPAHVPLELLAYDRAEAVDESYEFRVFELQDPRPLAHLVYDYRHAQGSAEFARQIMSDPRVNLRDMAVTLDPLPLELPVNRPTAAQVDSLAMPRPERIDMSVSTSDNALLTLAVPHYPGWRASVNGQRVQIVDVYAGLMGIVLTPGENQQVRFEFAPDSVRIGGLLSLAGLLLLPGISAAEWLWGRRASAKIRDKGANP